MAILEVNWQPSDRDLRVFAFVQLLAAGIIGWWLHRRLGWDGLAAVVVGGSVVGLIVGLIRPGILQTVFIAWMLAAFPIGWLMSHLFLAVVYYGVVTPIGFYLRWSGRDTLQRKPRPDAKSYWVARPELPESSRYFRQF
jgi:hypothetical protein